MTSRLNKIIFFYGLLLLNHLLHNYELNTSGFSEDFSLSKVALSGTILLQLLLLGVILMVGVQFMTGNKHAIRRAKWVSILFLAYGLLITLSVVYREENVVGSYSGFIYVMICLPLLINLTDYLKMRSGLGDEQH